MSSNAIPVHIREPIWKDKSVGIANFRLKEDGEIYLTIGYKDESGNKTFPHTYRMSAKKARTYPPTMTGGHPGRQIPIKDFEI